MKHIETMGGMDHRRKYHQCGYGSWALCTVCQGRLHRDDCTTRKNKLKDCCPARHKMLHDAGQIMGIDDSSRRMWEGK